MSDTPTEPSPRLTLTEARRIGRLIEGVDLGDYARLIEIARGAEREAERMIRAAQPDVGPDGFLRPRRFAGRDPRTGDVALFCPSRAHRLFRRVGRLCIIEDGELAPIFSWRMLPSGGERFCFVNMNMFPLVFPHGPGADDSAGIDASGLHFLFWPSNVHDEDLDRLPINDVTCGLDLLADLERGCLTGSSRYYAKSGTGLAGDHHGYFRIVRNSGELVGGSVAHPHFQMIHDGVADGHDVRDRAFLRDRGTGFAPWLIANTPPENVIRDYDEYVWLVPTFARRMLHSIIAARSANAGSLYETTPAERRALAAALSDYTGAVRTAMAGLGKEHAHNLVLHTGPIGGIYVEAIAHTQTVGGYEQAGKWVNLLDAAESARRFREALG